MVHPNNPKYIIVLDRCQEPKRFFINPIYQHLFVECSRIDIIQKMSEYHSKKLEYYINELKNI